MGQEGMCSARAQDVCSGSGCGVGISLQLRRVSALWEPVVVFLITAQTPTGMGVWLRLDELVINAYTYTYHMLISRAINIRLTTLQRCETTTLAGVTNELQRDN